APHAYTLRFEGQGGAAGFANGEARVTLSPADAGTTSMAYAVNAQVGGKLAQIGSRLIDGAARKLADDFFANFAAQFAAPVATDPPEVAADAAAARVAIATTAPRAVVEVPPAAPAAVRAPTGRSVWTRTISIAAIIVILAILYFKGGHFR
ncbi:MAG: SRPBCC domain-containing protein, partial [Casimicrobiaceae bacterium]